LIEANWKQGKEPDASDDDFNESNEEESDDDNNDDFFEDEDVNDDHKLPAKPASGIGLTVGLRVHKQGGNAYGTIVKSIRNCHWDVACDDFKLENKKVTYNQLIHDRENAGPPGRFCSMTSFSRPI
jgi:hypothetical protein